MPTPIYKNAICRHTFRSLERRHVTGRFSIGFMSLQLLTEGPWGAIEEALLEYLCETPSDGSLIERWVLVPHRGLARYLQHRAAGPGPGSSGVRFLRFNDLAIRLLRSYGRSPAPEMGEVVRDLLLRRVLRDQLPQLERRLGLSSVATTAFADAVRKTLNDLREAGIEAEAIRVLATRSGGRNQDRLEAVADLHAAWVDLLDRTDAFDPEGLVREAATVTSGLPPGSLPGLAVYGFYDLTGGQWELLRSLTGAATARIYTPVYPETEAYAGALLGEWRDRAERVETIPAGEATSRRPASITELWSHLAEEGHDRTGTVTVLSAPGTGREVDTALRIVAAAWSGNSRGDDARLLAADPDSYRKPLSQQARSNGFAVEGARGSPRDDATGLGTSAGAACPAGLLDLLQTALNAHFNDLSADAITRLLHSLTCAGEEEPITLLGGSFLQSVAAGGDLDQWIEGLGKAVDREEAALERSKAREGVGPGRASLRERVRAQRRHARVDSLRLADERLRALRDLLLRLPSAAPWAEWVEALRSLAISLVSPAWYGEIDDALERLRGLTVLSDEVGIAEVIEAVRAIEQAMPAGGPLPLHNLMELRGTRGSLSIVLGLAEGSWPRRPAQDPLLLDSERKALTGSEEWLLSTSRRRVDEERLLFRLMLETGDHVLLLYPRLDETGRERRASPHILELMRLITEKELSQDQLESLAAKGTRRLGDIRPMAGGPLMGDLDRDLAAVGEALDSESVEALRALWGSPTFREGWRAELARWRGEAGPWSGFLTTVPARDLACRLLGLEEEGALSVSLLESYCSCPWKVFTGRVLGLPEEETETDGLLDSAEMGSVLHDVFQEYVEDASRAGGWPPAPEEIEGLREELAGMVGRHVRRAYQQRGMPAPLFGQIDERRALKRVLGWLRWEAGPDDPDRNSAGDLGSGASTGWEMLAAEEAFDIPMDIADREIRLIGRWDRIDRDREGRIRIIDYKTGKGAPGETGTLGGGLNLQMYLYLLAAVGHLREQGTVSGGLFLHLRPDRPEGPPGAVIWPIEEVMEGRENLEQLVLSLLESMERGVFVRLPHDDRTDNRSGLCSWCPTPTICRGWRAEESIRHRSDELLSLLNRARSMDQVNGGGER